MRHVTRKVLSVNGEASALCRLKPSAHARVYPSRTGVALASPSSRLQPSPARPFPVTLLEELCTVEDFSGLAGPTQDFFLAAAKRRSDWRTPPPGREGVDWPGPGAGGGADIPEAAAAAAELV